MFLKWLFFAENYDTKSFWKMENSTTNEATDQRRIFWVTKQYGRQFSTGQQSSLAFSSLRRGVDRQNITNNLCSIR